ncbi:Uncharacterized membrane protein [Rhizobium sp. RU20A]|uniref:heparan-alpha-glucosaminide N-acetyltransferase n=1 Tax=Rhizobium sp. RU20A TaxID=1907412 RepID=UPI0009570216|nr:DUF1624 domain-containing protein [Rhizobium sp. RU20A]SIQ12870.1 Uncharacterized membrane protein [Rhizobium sp. RU20A]
MTTQHAAAGTTDDRTAIAVPPARRRIEAIDMLRGLALVAMAIYHFGWDLDHFGYLERGVTAVGGWKMLARATAGSFLFLAGVGLVLAHGTGTVRWRPFLFRLGKVYAAAALITVATYIAFPQSFIFFGILHAIGTFSLIGLAFLRVPGLVSILLGAAAIAAPFYLRAPLFDTPALWWVGLSTVPPVSNDYVPLFPWIGPFFAGMGLTRLLAGRVGALGRAAEHAATQTPLKYAASAGRHSLAVYLIHQPVLFGLVYAVSLVAPPPPPDLRADYVQSCVRACSAEPSPVSCAAFCTCTLQELDSRNLFTPMQEGTIDLTTDARITEIREQCTLSSPPVQPPAP